MHYSITIVVVALLYVGLFHTRVNPWVALIAPLALAAVAHAVAPGSQSGVGLVVEYLALFLVGSIGLATRTIDSVADDLDRSPVFETDPGVTGVDAADYQKYCELGGNALVALGRYADAAELFLRLNCAPAARATHAHAAAHKKYVLCSLIADGACAFASSLPKYASPAVAPYRHTFPTTMFSSGAKVASASG